jgi:cytidyltransferase-like protein
MIIGYTSGTFDLFHVGHERYLKECAAQCDFLYIGIDSDSSVKRLKGRLRPIQGELIRLMQIRESYPKAFIKMHKSQFYIPVIKPNIIFESSEKVSVTAGAMGISRVIIPYTKTISTTKVITRNLSTHILDPGS